MCNTFPPYSPYVNSTWCELVPSCSMPFESTAMIVIDLHVTVSMTTGGDLHFMLNGQRLAYNSDTALDIRDIGTGGSALLCVTDRAGCCTGAGRTGEWYYPDGRRVNIQAAGEDFYRNRGDRILRLNRVGNVLGPTGQYRCEVPDASGVTQNIYITITGKLMSKCCIFQGRMHCALHMHI